MECRQRHLEKLHANFSSSVQEFLIFLNCFMLFIDNFVFFSLKCQGFFGMSPKGISTNSGPILRIYENFEKIGIIIYMKLNPNNVNYKFLYSGSNQNIPLWFLRLRYTLYVPQGYQSAILDQFGRYVQNIYNIEYTSSIYETYMYWI